MELSKTESKRVLRSLELKAYRNVVDALRAQGALTKNKHEVLKNLAATLKVGEERCRSEVRRAVNDDVLSLIAQSNNGNNTEWNWRNESARKVPLMPMVASQTAFTALADNISDMVVMHNSQFSETSQPLTEILEERKNLTDENLSRYYSSKTFRPLLSNKKFRDEAILAELEKIQLCNKYPQPDELEEHEEPSYTVPCEPMITKTVTWDDRTHHDIISHFDSKTIGNVSTSFSNPGVNTSTKSKILKKPVTRTTTGARPEQSVQNVKNAHSSKNIISKPRRFDTEGKDKITETVTPKDNSFTTCRTNVPLKRKEATIVKPTPVISECPIVTINDQSKPNKRSRPKPGTKKRPSLISSIHKENSIKESRIESESTEPRPFSKVSRRKSNSFTIIEDFPDESLPRLLNDKGTEARNTDIRTSVPENVEKTTEEVFSSAKLIDVLPTNVNPKLPVSVLTNFELNLPSAQVEEEMRPHTFNLIPASRRFKLRQKRTKSPNGEIEVSSKRFVDENSMSANNISTDENSKVVSNSSNSLSTNSMKSTSPKQNKKRSLLPSTKKRLSLLGSVKVRNWDTKSPSTSKKLNDRKDSFGKKKFGAAEKISTFHAFMGGSSDSLSDDATFEESSSRHGGFLGFTTNGFNSTFDSDFSDFSDQSSIEFSESGEVSPKKTFDETLRRNDDVNASTESAVQIETQQAEQLIDIASADVIIGDQDVSLSDSEAEQIVFQNAQYDDVRVLTPTKDAKAMKTRETTPSSESSSQNTESTEFVTTVVNDQNDKNNLIAFGGDKSSPRPTSQMCTSSEQRQLPTAQKKIVRSKVSASAPVTVQTYADLAAKFTSSVLDEDDVLERIRKFRQNISNNVFTNKSPPSVVADTVTASGGVSSLDSVGPLVSGETKNPVTGETLINVTSSSEFVNSSESNEVLVARVCDNSDTLVLTTIPMISSESLLALTQQGDASAIPGLVAPSYEVEVAESSSKCEIEPTKTSVEFDGTRKPKKKARILPPRSRFDKQIRRSPKLRTIPPKKRVDGENSTKVPVLNREMGVDDEGICVTTSTASVDDVPRSIGNEEEGNPPKSRITAPKVRVANDKKRSSTKPKIEGDGCVKVKSKKSGLASIMRMRTNTLASSSASVSYSMAKMSLKTMSNVGQNKPPVSSLTQPSISKVNFFKNETKPLMLPHIPSKVFELYEPRDHVPIAPVQFTTINNKSVAVKEESLIEILPSKKLADLEISDNVVEIDDDDESYLEDSGDYVEL